MIDITLIDLQHESLKLKNKKAERDLLSSISECGIKEAFLGFYENNFFVLIDGFKRYRCCQKLHISTVPIEIMAKDASNSFIKALKLSNTKSLHILEQAKFIEELNNRHGMTIKDIAISLTKSFAWVQVRLRMITNITPAIYDYIQKDNFPVRSYMYTLDQLTRVNKITNEEIEGFMEATSKKGLSSKDIDLLAHGYFKGGQDFKDQIKNGNFVWSLNKLKDVDKKHSGLKDEEKRFLKDLEISSKYIGRIIFKAPQLQVNNNLTATGGILAEGILNKLDRLKSILSNFVKEGKK